MSNAAQQPLDRAASLAAFDAGYSAFLAAFAQAPDDALPYVPPGDEYALGVLPVHLLDPIRRYMAVLDRLLGEGFAPIDLGAGPEGAAMVTAAAEWHAFLVAQRPTGAERAAMLADLEDAHRSVHVRTDALDEDTFARQAPVIYSPGANPFATSARDLVGWLTDHYHEHVDQVGQILAIWRA